MSSPHSALKLGIFQVKKGHNSRTVNDLLHKFKYEFHIIWKRSEEETRKWYRRSRVTLNASLHHSGGIKISAFQLLVCVNNIAHTNICLNGMISDILIQQLHPYE